MTTTSIAIGLLMALFCGLLAGRCLREFRAGNAWATALAAALGLAILRCSRPEDLIRVIQPKVAIDWVPLGCLLSAACMTVKSVQLRAVLGGILAVLIPFRLLWGSVYLPTESWTISILMCLGVWTVCLVIPFLLPDHPVSGKSPWRIGLWALTTAGTAVTVSLSGSLTYAAAAGICGAGTLGVLISTATIPGIAAIPFVCLIGLTASFAELPVLVASMLMSAWMAALIAEHAFASRMVIGLRCGATFVLAVSFAVTVARNLESRAVSEGAGSAYRSQDRDSDAEFETLRSMQTPVARESHASDPHASDHPSGAGSSVDPFEGLNSN